MGASTRAQQTTQPAKAPAASPDTWVFNAEATSTLLIALWFIVGTYVRLKILPAGPLYHWCGSCLVPILFYVFYFGTGYLFQQHQQVYDFRSWGHYFRREAVILLTPCIAFTLIILGTGSAIAATPGIAASGIVPSVMPFTPANLINGLFVEPVVASGYFLALVVFFIFARTPKTQRGMNALIAFGCGVKCLAIVLTDTGLSASVPIVIMQVLNNWVWFIAGMALSFYDIPKNIANMRVAAALIGVFLILCGVFYGLQVSEAALITGLSAVGVGVFYSLAASCFYKKRQVRFYGFVTRYTMAIWLMHPSMTELVFCALYALGCSAGGAVTGAWIPLYAITCVMSCYVLTVLVMKLLFRVWKLGFFVYPARYLPASF